VHVDEGRRKDRSRLLQSREVDFKLRQDKYRLTLVDRKNKENRDKEIERETHTKGKKII
jgi:hypothetical protein